MENKLPSQVEKELSAREIFNRIVKGQVIRIPNDPALAKQLQNHLNVIKSREKRIFADLGLDFISSVVSVTPVFGGGIVDTRIDGYQVKLIAPKKRKKYTAFVIANEQPNPI